MSKKAVLIGINYFGTSSELQGCQNDVNNISKMLVNVFDFQENNITFLKDLPNDPNHIDHFAPTKNNVLRELRKLVSESTKGDKLFVQYSGHGSWINETGPKPNEKDGRTETIYLVDENEITDNELNEILVQNLPNGVQLRCIFDSCHSGTVVDMTYLWNFIDLVSIENTDLLGTNHNCMMISGCRDHETSADAPVRVKGGQEYEGAMTWALLTSLKEFGFDYEHGATPGRQLPTWKDIMFKMRSHILRGRFTQIPQLSFCSRSQLRNDFDL